MNIQQEQKKRSNSGWIKPIKYIVGLGIIHKVTKSVINNLFRAQVIPQFGSVVYCDLAFGIAEHSGIYVGNNSIVHLNSEGLVEKISLTEFIKKTPAITIYVSCKDGVAIGCETTGNNALAKIGKKTQYNIFKRNCHQFVSGCVTGNFNNGDLLLTKLKRTMLYRLGINEWRVLAQ